MIHRLTTRQGASRARPGLALALVKQADRLDDPSFPGLRRLRAVDRQHMTELVAIGQPVEKRPGGGIRVQCGSEIVGYRDLAWLLIQLQIDIDLIAGRDPSACAMLT